MVSRGRYHSEYCLKFKITQYPSVKTEIRGGPKIGPSFGPTLGWHLGLGPRTGISSRKGGIGHLPGRVVGVLAAENSLVTLQFAELGPVQ